MKISEIVILSSVGIATSTTAFAESNLKAGQAVLVTSGAKIYNGFECSAISESDSWTSDLDEGVIMKVIACGSQTYYVVKRKGGTMHIFDAKDVTSL